MTKENKYKKVDNQIVLSFPYNPSIVSDIKEIDYTLRRFDPISKEWFISISFSTNKIIKDILEKYQFSAVLSDDNTKADIFSYLSKISRKKGLKSFRNDIQKLNQTSQLKPYLFQEEDIDMMCNWDKMINGNDMGLGKSLETIYCAEIRDCFPMLLVCPSSTKYQWMELWKKVNEKRTVSVIDSSIKQNDFSSDVIIINYDILGNKELISDEDEEKKKYKYHPKYQELLEIKWQYVCIDEIHYVKNNSSIRSQIIKQITKGVDIVHGLTGTLVENRPVEIVNPLIIIGRFNELFNNWNNFVYRYCKAKQTRFGLDCSGNSNLVEFNTILRENCYIRREKRDVLTDLPDIQESVLDVTITNKKEYLKAENNFIDYINKNFTREKFDSAMMAQCLVQRNLLRQLSVDGKVKSIIKFLDDLKEQTSEKVLIVGNYSNSLKTLSNHFKNILIDGSLTAIKKREEIKKWNNNKQQFLFTNCIAIGTGTDGLQDKCSSMVIIDLPSKPSILDQTISRLERIGQKNNINIYYLLSKQTIDMVIWAAIQLKRKISNEVNKGIETEIIDIDKVIINHYLK